MAKKLTLDRVMKAARADDGIGFCISCGNDQRGCEPDAQEYTCESCGKPTVYGADEILLQGLVK